MSNPNATNPVSGPSGDRNQAAPTKSEAEQLNRRRHEDLERQAQGTQVTGLGKAKS
jgi:hypothetical protein